MNAVPSPYSPLHPTDNPAWFFGREDAFAFFRQHLVGMPLAHGLVLSGRRGLGKTSLLHQLQFQLDKRYPVCVVGLGAAELADEAAFFGALAEEIRLTLDDVGVSTYRLPDWPEPGPDGAPPDLRAWFDTVYLDIAMTALRQRHLLLALDDAHRLLNAIDQGALPADLIDYLAGLVAAYERLDILFALDDAYEDRALAISLLADPALHYRLAELPREDAERLVREPVADLYSYGEGIVPRILALTGGHPFLIHSICRLIFRRSEERHHAGPIIELDLIAVYPAVLEQAGEILGPLWRDASQNERLTLTALAGLTGEDPGPGVPFEALHAAANDMGYEVSKTQLASALRSLDYKGLVQMDAAGRYFFPAGLIPRWLYANTDVPTPTPPPEDAPRSWGRPALFVLAAIALVALIGVVALAGAFDGDDEAAVVGTADAPTATLSLNLEATRQSDAATQTEDARPTLTRTPTDTPEPTATDTATPSETPTDTPTRTNTPPPSITPEPTDTPAPSDTPRPTQTPSRTPTAAPSATRTPNLIERALTATADYRTTTAPTARPTRTPRPSPMPTLDPGG